MSNIDDGIGTKNDSSASSDTGSFGLISLVKRGLQSLTSIITNLPNTANGVKVDGSAVTQPVSGTVTSNIGTIAGIATETTLSAINTNSTNGNKITQSRGTYNATPPTLTDGTNSNIQLDINGNLKTVSQDIGAKADVVANSDTGTFSLIALFKRALQSLTTIATNTGAQSLDTISTGSINALNGNVAVNAQGSYTVSAIVTGTWVGTLVAEGLMADGTTWQQLPMYLISTTLPYLATSSITNNQSVLITGGGYTQVRIRALAFTSGTAIVSLNASLAQQTIFASQLGTWNVNTELNKSVFGELLTADKKYDIQLIYCHGLNSRLIKQTATGSGTITVANSMLNVATNTTTGTAKAESFNSINYIAGIGVEAMFTFLFQTGTGNTTQEIGLKNSENGFTFAYINGVLGINYTSNSVTTFIPQSSFNIDKIDGTGLSGFNIDVTKGNLGKIQFQYLGFGDIQFFIKPSNSTGFIEIHRINYTNANTVPSVFKPYYKMYMFVSNASNPTVAVSMKSASFSACLQGSLPIYTQPTSIRNLKTGITTETNIITVRNNTTINGGTNFIPVKLLTFSASTSASNRSVVFRIIKNATIGGTPVFNNISTTDSVLATDTAGTTVTGGIELTSFSVSPSSDMFIDLKQYGFEFEAGDTITISAQSSNSSECSVTLDLREQW